MARSGSVSRMRKRPPYVLGNGDRRRLKIRCANHDVEYTIANMRVQGKVSLLSSQTFTCTERYAHKLLRCLLLSTPFQISSNVGERLGPNLPRSSQNSHERKCDSDCGRVAWKAHSRNGWNRFHRWTPG